MKKAISGTPRWEIFSSCAKRNSEDVGRIGHRSTKGLPAPFEGQYAPHPRLQQPLLLHPRIIEDCAQVAGSGVRKQRDDPASVHRLRNLTDTPQGRPG